MVTGERSPTVRFPWCLVGLAGALLAFAWVGIVATAASASPSLPLTRVFSSRDTVHPVVGRYGMVSTQEEMATRVGIDVLKGGGNAVDAAVAIGFTLAVTLPRAGNLGGGGFMLIHDAASQRTVALDFREKAPRAANRDMFLGPSGEVDQERARQSIWSVAVPGTVAGLAAALHEFGTRTLADSVAPAMRLAKHGIPVSVDMAHSLAANGRRLSRWPETAKIFLNAGGEPWQPGQRLLQTDLAWSLQEIADHGAGAFYSGRVGQRIVAAVAEKGGLIAQADMIDYRPVVRQPVAGLYRGYRIMSMPPPSSGGVHLIQILNILEGYPIGNLGHNSAGTLHLMAEAMKLAYADRSKYLGDPDFSPIPVTGLVSKAYAAELRGRIDRGRARRAAEIGPGEPGVGESRETTHFTVMDRYGNVVSTTYTLNFSYGSGIVAAGTGILLNNEMDDFSSKPGVPNAYGLIGGEANAIAGGKRPLSSMTPTIVFKDGRPFLATGSPGGSRIITTTLQVLLNVIDHGMNVAMATFAPRVHHQWLPDALHVETGISPDTLRMLAAMGHSVVEADAMGSTQSIVRLRNGFFGASDPRRPGALTLGL